MTILGKLVCRVNGSPFPSSSSPNHGFTKDQPPQAPIAFSMTREQQNIYSTLGSGRVLCADRKPWYNQFTTNSLVKSTLKVSMTQGGFILQNYASEQLELDGKLDKLVDEGTLSRQEAKEAAADWEKKEWQSRWSEFPARFANSYLKYHVVVGIMRFYEYIAEQMFDDITLDALTLDTTKRAKQVASEKKSTVQIGREMFGVSLYANFIAFLADYSVHQAILLYFVGSTIYARRQQRLKEADSDMSTNNFLADSGNLVISRTLEAVCCAFGGAIGTMVWPGWGTLMGENLGDGVGISLADQLKVSL